MDNRNKDKNPTLEEIEKDETTPVESEQPQEDEDALEETTTPEEEIIEQKEEEDKEEKPTSQQIDNQPPDYKERYKESTREAQVLHERNRQITSAIEEAANINEPSEQELKSYVTAKGGDWDLLDNFQRNLAKDSLIAKKKFDHAYSEVQKVSKIDEWAQKVDSFTEENEQKQTYKNLIGREGDFRAWAMKPTHRGLPIDTLVAAYLYTNKPTPNRKGSMFIAQGGGQKPEAPKSDEIVDADEAARLRSSSPREFQRLVKAGKVKIDL